MQETLAVKRDDIARYSVVERLKDQRSVTIRAVRPSDKGLIIEALRGLSADSIYFRLFASKKEFTDADLKEITEVADRVIPELKGYLAERGVPVLRARGSSLSRVSMRWRRL